MPPIQFYNDIIAWNRKNYSVNLKIITFFTPNKCRRNAEVILLKKLLVILLGFILCTTTKVYAEDAATVTVTVKDLPQKLQNRTVIVTLGNGPSDTESTIVILGGLNNYTETVTIAPSEYYCAAAVQYDALEDYPLQEINQTTFCKQKAVTTTT